MRSISPELQAHLDSGATTLAWCWRITRSDGMRLGFTDHDQSLSFDSTLFEAATGFTTTEIRSSAGFAVDNLEIASALTSDTLDERDLALGHFDNASIEIYRVNWQDPEQRVRLHVGALGEIRRTGTAFFAEVRGLMHRLDQPTGRLYQHVCDATFGDQRCTIDKTTPQHRFATTITAADGYRLQLLPPTAPFAEHTFNRGTLVASPASGPQQSFDVRRVTFGPAICEVELWQTPKQPLAIGLNVELFAGCDKRFETCRDRFANAVNFRGFPAIPGTDFITAVAAPGAVQKVGAST